MGTIKYTKNELKYQKDALARFQRYLPTLMLKKQQLQMEIRKVKLTRDQQYKQRDGLQQALMEWVDVFGEEMPLEEWFGISGLETVRGNIAGVDIPIFQDIEFKRAEYDLFQIPLWVDTALVELQKITALDAENRILEEQVRLLADELRITSQRVNLFEKVKIPEAQEYIRIIQIYLGDQQTAAVVRGKISKGKLVKVS